MDSAITSIKQNADFILYDLGLLDRLRQYGVPHVVGSYAIDAMAHNDLDIDVTNQAMSLERLHRLTGYILETYRPTWYEAKQEITRDGRTVWFHGFEAVVRGELWNLDIWFFDEETIRQAEAFCARVKSGLDGDPAKREAVIRLKRSLLEQGLYPSGPYTGMDVYEAVLQQNILTMDEFLARRAK